MFRTPKTDALVVGAGPVGLFAAVSLAEAGRSVEILDAQDRTAAHSYALALHPGSLELLDRIGLAEELIAKGHRIDQVAFYAAAERLGAVELSRTSGDFPFVLVLPQDALEEALERRLGDRGVEVRWGHRLAALDLDGHGATATIDQIRRGGEDGASWSVVRSGEIRSAFLLGADGHHSRVRRALEIGFPQVGQRQFYGVFELAAGSGPPPSEVRVVFGDGHADVLWPLGEGRFRWSFELEDTWEFVSHTREKDREPDDAGEAYYLLDEARLRRLAAERAPWFDGDVDGVTWSVAVRFERRLAERFGRGRAALAGDAAHLAPPVGVQSMNSGLAEAWAFARTVDAIARGNARPDALEDCGRRRRCEWRHLLDLGEHLVIRTDAPAWARQRASCIVTSLPASGPDLGRLLHQVGLELA